MVNEKNNWELTVFRRMEKDDVDALRYFFETYYSDLCNFANLFVKDESSAEEIIQEIFFGIWNNRKNIKIRSSVRSYLYTAAKNRILNFIRDEKKRLNTYMKFNKMNHEPAIQPDQVFLEKELNQIIRKAVDELPVQCRKIFSLSREEGYSNKRISEELSISEKTVENQMTIALQRLREFARAYGIIL